MASKQKVNFRYRLKYSRTGVPAWIGHLDLMRTFQYSCKRAKLPSAFTEGYNPRPIMEFGLPVGVGIETRADPLDLELVERIPVQAIMQQLNLKLPQGLQIETAEYLEYPEKNLMSLVEAAAYTIIADDLGAAAEKVILSDDHTLVVERIRKGKKRIYDLRELIIDLQVITSNQIKFLCKAGSIANLRPDMLLKALYEAEEITKTNALGAIIIRDRVFLKNEKLSY
ncbi:MAG: TIGR03936 family radical SAM-associated protein [Saccharofermentanales bacterium]|jgi:radical SAM-linked protein